MIPEIIPDGGRIVGSTGRIPLRPHYRGPNIREKAAARREAVANLQEVLTEKAYEAWTDAEKAEFKLLYPSEQGGILEANPDAAELVQVVKNEPQAWESPKPKVEALKEDDASASPTGKPIPNWVLPLIERNPGIRDKLIEIGGTDNPKQVRLSLCKAAIEVHRKELNAKEKEGNSK